MFKTRTTFQIGLLYAVMRHRGPSYSSSIQKHNNTHSVYKMNLAKWLQRLIDLNVGEPGINCDPL